MKTVWILLLLVAFFLSSLATFASGMTTVKGKLISITETDFIIESQYSTYRVKRSAVPKSVAEKIDRPSKFVSLTVPFDAVDTMKPAKKK